MTKLSWMIRRWLSLALILFVVWPLETAQAQTGAPIGPVYVVQPGDNIWTISQLFGLSVDELVSFNHIADPNILKVGDRLVIPRLEDVQGELKVSSMPFGESLRSLSRRNQLTESMLARLNHLTSPGLMYAGSNLVLLNTGSPPAPTRRGWLVEGESLLEMAVLQGMDPWTLVSTNRLGGQWDGLPGDILAVLGEGDQGPGGLPPAISAVEINPQPFMQGKTIVFQVSAPVNTTLSGSVTGRELHFFSDGQGKYVALQGVHAMQDVGLYPILLNGVMPDGTPFKFIQSIYLAEGAYAYDPPLYVDPSTIDPEVTRPEDAEWTALALPATDEKLWSGQFTSPVAPEFADCWPSRYGSRRSFNDSLYSYFHTGLDFCGAVGNAVLAPAAGVVVFAGPLSVRGNATLINHGWGIYTGYMHQSEILVKVGDRVEAGQQVGLVGATGRVTGAHLHWEVFAGGVQVDPMDWLQRAYP